MPLTEYLTPNRNGTTTTVVSEMWFQALDPTVGWIRSRERPTIRRGYECLYPICTTDCGRPYSKTKCCWQLCDAVQWTNKYYTDDTHSRYPWNARQESPLAPHTSLSLSFGKSRAWSYYAKTSAYSAPPSQGRKGATPKPSRTGGSPLIGVDEQQVNGYAAYCRTDFRCESSRKAA